MAVTSLWRVHGEVGKVVMYVQNPDKTTEGGELDRQSGDAENALKALTDYVERDSATNQKRYVWGLNCSPDTAAEEMMEVKRRFGKTGGVVAYHGYQSFATGEVSPETAHEIGIKLAEELWGERYQVIVTTHLDKDSHIHNHFCVNTVSFIDGRKYHRTNDDYMDMQYVSDRLCEEYGLSIIYHPKQKGQNYGEWKAENEGKYTIRGSIRQAIDVAIAGSVNLEQFKDAMDQMGYTMDFHGKYPKIKPAEAEHFFRFKSLGPGYDIEDIFTRIMDNNRPEYPDIPPQDDPLNVFEGDATPIREMPIYRVYGCFIRAVEITMTRPEANRHMYFLLRDEHQQLERYRTEFRIAAENKLETDVDLANVKMKTEERLSDETNRRKDLRNALKRAERAGNEQEAYSLRNDIAASSRRIKDLRDELEACYRIGERSGILREKLEIIHSEKFRASEISKTKEKLNTTEKSQKERKTTAYEKS